MRLAFLAAMLLAVLPAPAPAALAEGANAPHFSAPAALAGRQFTYSLAESLKKGPVVVYFYPSAYTAGCNVQAHTFSQRMAEFTAAGASVIGVSLDDIGRLEEFSADPDYCAGRLAVASDADGSIAKGFDLTVRNVTGVNDSRGRAITHGFAERTTFIVTPDGRIARTIGGLNPKENVEQSLAAVRALGKR
ncbi:MAG: peroxiredoxin [Gammaproteobacteria bacterium]